MSDILFQDLDENVPCRLLGVEQEHSLSRFFGLNCKNSNVLASGIKTSTFEKAHTIPSFWMSIMSKIMGVKRASALGAQFEKFAMSCGLIQ